MNIDGSEEWFPLPDEHENRPEDEAPVSERLDSLFPVDAETSVATYDALRTCLSAFMDLMARQGQPLTLLAIAADPSDSLKRLGNNGALLIGMAIARCLRQETRIHDVVGRAQIAGGSGVPAFLIVLPLMTEALAAQFAERLREAMTTTAGEAGRSWLTVSVGVASLSLDTHSADTLILRAQGALASAQRAGGGRVWGHSDSLRRIVERDRPDALPE
jgi:GGDEF domain-containing protein